jgi:hypothetical protein
MSRLKLQNAVANLLEIVLALRPPGRFAGRLHGRHEQRHQEPEDGDHAEQLHERKAAATAVRI